MPAAAWTAIPYWQDGGADVAEISFVPFADQRDAQPVRCIVRRVRPSLGSQLARFAPYSYHAAMTDRQGDTQALEADHRRHAEIENAIRDLKYGVGLNRLPSGRLGANAAWLAFQVLAPNLARWTGRIGLGEALLTTKTLRRRFFSLPARPPARPGTCGCTCPRSGPRRTSSVPRSRGCGPSRCGPNLTGRPRSDSRAPPQMEAKRWASHCARDLRHHEPRSGRRSRDASS